MWDSKSTLSRPFIWIGTGIVLITIIRFWYAAHLGLSPDEAYYWRWSLDLSFSYPDHPPMVAWLIRMGTTILGPTAIGVRLSSVIMGMVAPLFIYHIARMSKIPSSVALLCAALSAILPMPAVGAIMATPDVFLGLCWILSVWCLFNLFQKNHFRYWYILGGTTGLALLTKHSAIMIYILALTSTLLLPAQRQHLRTIHPWVAFGLSISIGALYLGAEWQSGFPALGHQHAHLAGALPGHASPLFLFPLRWLEVIGGQWALLSPVVGVLTGMGIWRWRMRPSPHAAILIGLTLPIGATLIAAIFTHPEQNWAALGHPLAAILIPLVLSNSPLTEIQRNTPSTTSANKGWLLVLSTSILFTGVIHTHAMYLILPLPSRTDPVSSLHGWNNLKTIADTYRTQKHSAIVCDNYALASMLAWQYRNEQLPQIINSTDRPGFIPKGNWLILDQQNDYGNAIPQANCERYHPLGCVTLHRKDNRPARTIRIQHGINCTGSSHTDNW